MQQRKVDFSDHECFECGRFCKNRRALGNHLHRTHVTSIEHYVLKHYCSGQRPLCLCGCGQPVNWHKSQYFFCDYLSGHNDDGFSKENQPNWTPEKVASRNDSIRKAYRNRGQEISEKISSSLKVTFNDPSVRQRMLDAQNAGRACPGVMAKIAAVRKRVWAEQYDELYAKIFTPEFGWKISAANMRHDMKHTSKEEEHFKDHLVSIFSDDIQYDGLWINDDVDRAAHFDILLRSKKMLVEWDGTYYHGLDRDRCFDLTQLIHITNDFRKNRIAANHGYGIIRIPGTVDVDLIGSYDDLVNQARHVQLCDGTVLKDGMFRFNDDFHPIISREQLIRINETGLFSDALGRSYTEQYFLPVIRAFLHEYATTRGWFYPSSDETLDNAIQSIKKTQCASNDDTISSLGHVGSSFLKSMFRSYWDVLGGPQESFWDDKILDRVVSYRLGLNDSKDYTYTLSDGQIVQCKETFDINIKNVRYGFIVQRVAVSWFKPGTAYAIYKRMLGDVSAPAVWDPSCGFGARLLGFLAAYPKGTYIGTDPATPTFRDLCTLKGLASHLGTNIDLHCIGSESFDPGRELDLVFTSLPYFDREKYFDEDTQCWKKFSMLDSWRDGYLVPTFQSAFQRLKLGAKMVINIDQKNEAAVTQAALDVGFKQLPSLSLAIGRDHFSKKKGHVVGNAEPILVFEK